MKDIILSVFQARSYPHLAAAVRAASPRVVNRWLSAIKEHLPSADELTLGELRNSIPSTLERLALALASDRAAPTRELMVEGQEHGVDRLHQSYNLTELLIEFDLLRPILIEEVASELTRDLDLAEFTALNIGIDLMSRRSVIAFVTRQKQQLMDAAQMQSRYFAFLSHDIRGGLNAILMNIDLLKLDLPKDPKFAPAIEDLESMRRTILNTVGVMSRFLEAERLRNGNLQPKIALFDLQRLIADVSKQFRFAASAKGLELREEIAEGFELESDRELVTLMLQNLVGNAIKYCTQGTVTITAVISPAGVCDLSVRDEGPGIPPERVVTLFEAFKRGETHGQPGDGLGLAIVDNAARLLGAKITVDSEPGTGTTFHVLFPRKSPS